MPNLIAIGVEASARYQGILYKGRVTQVAADSVHLDTSWGVFCIPKTLLKIKPTLAEAMNQAFVYGQMYHQTEDDDKRAELVAKMHALIEEMK